MGPGRKSRFYVESEPRARGALSSATSVTAELLGAKPKSECKPKSAHPCRKDGFPEDPAEEAPEEASFSYTKHTLPIGLVNLGEARNAAISKEIFLDVLADATFATIQLETSEDMLKAMDASKELVRSEPHHGIVIWAKRKLARDVKILETIATGKDRQICMAVIVEVIWDEWLVECSVHGAHVSER